MNEKDFRIVKAEIIQPVSFGDKAKVLATFEDGRAKVVVEYFHDELFFTPEEVVGLTQEEVGELHFKKDKAYLQS